MSTITVRSMKNILHHDFSQQRRKENSLSLLPLDEIAFTASLDAGSSGIVKVGIVFIKKCLRSNHCVTAFPKHAVEILNKKQLDFICPGLEFVS